MNWNISSKQICSSWNTPWRLLPLAPGSEAERDVIAEQMRFSESYCNARKRIRTEPSVMDRPPRVIASYQRRLFFIKRSNIYETHLVCCMKIANLPFVESILPRQTVNKDRRDCVNICINHWIQVGAPEHQMRQLSEVRVKALVGRLGIPKRSWSSGRNQSQENKGERIS